VNTTRREAIYYINIWPFKGISVHFKALFRPPDEAGSDNDSSFFSSVFGLLLILRPTYFNLPSFLLLPSFLPVTSGYLLHVTYLCVLWCYITPPLKTLHNSGSGLFKDLLRGWKLWQRKINLNLPIWIINDHQLVWAANIMWSGLCKTYISISVCVSVCVCECVYVCVCVCTPLCRVKPPH